MSSVQLEQIYESRKKKILKSNEILEYILSYVFFP